MSGEDVNKTIRLGRLLECRYCKHMIGTTENCPGCQVHRLYGTMLNSIGRKDMTTETPITQSALMSAQYIDKVSKMVISELNDLQEGDWEITHCLAETYLLNFLDLTGHKDIADAFREAKDRCNFTYS